MRPSSPKKLWSKCGRYSALVLAEETRVRRAPFVCRLMLTTCTEALAGVADIVRSFPQSTVLPDFACALALWCESRCKTLFLSRVGARIHAAVLLQSIPGSAAQLKAGAVAGSYRQLHCSVHRGFTRRRSNCLLRCSP